MPVCRALWAVLAACLITACSTTASVPNAIAPAPAPPDAGPPAPIRVLQLNLCNSGIASCYTGRATAEAAAVIAVETPDVVTLNEICRGDLPALEAALAEAVPGSSATSAFAPARDGVTGEPYTCRNGQQYGIGIVSRWPSNPTTPPVSGIYPDQDPADPEQRAWLCLDAAASPAVAVCTTHLAYTRRDVTVAQCRHLFETVVAQVRARDGERQAVVSGDLNLGPGDDPDLRSCLPSDAARVDDGSVQHVVATPALVVAESRTVELAGSTDHPGLLVTLARPAP